MRTASVLRNAPLFLCLIFFPLTAVPQRITASPARWNLFLNKVDLEVKGVWPIITRDEPVYGVQISTIDSTPNETDVVAKLTARNGAEYNRRICSVTSQTLIGTTDEENIAAIQDCLQKAYVGALSLQRRGVLATQEQMHFDPDTKSKDMVEILNEFFERQVFSHPTFLPSHSGLAWRMELTVDKGEQYILITVPSLHANGTDYLFLTRCPLKDLKDPHARSIAVIEMVDRLIKYAVANGIVSPNPGLHTT